MMELSLAPSKVLRLRVILMEGEEIAMEDIIKMGKKWIRFWNVVGE